MPRVERVPGRRKALSHRLDISDEQPARARAPRPVSSPADGERPSPPVPGARSSTVLGVLWLLAFVAATAALAMLRYLESEAILQQWASAVLGVVLAVGLAVRCGGRALSALVLAGLVGATAVATQWLALLAGTALATGVLAACLAVLGTRPARTFPRAVLEVLLALVVAASGALGVAGFQVVVNLDRFSYTVLGVSLAAVVALVYRLGGGLHSLGRGGVLLVVAALVLLVVGLAYTAALTRWGSPEFRVDVDSAKHWLNDHLGAVPHLIEVLLGIPALVWGVSMRDRRRQGWWVCAFGVTATAAVTTRLVDDHTDLRTIALGEAYSLVLGLLVGFVVIRVVRFLRRTPGRRSSRTNVATRRPEPPRLQPLH